jgi:hypothetical protein
MVHDIRTDRAADAENILDALSVDDPDFNRFEGEFAAVVYDARRDVTCGFNDHTSLLHLYYVECGGNVYFTTAPLATARVLGLGLDPASVREFLARGQVMCPRSMHKGMNRLSLGEHVRLGRGTLRLGRHWSPYHEPISHRNKRVAAEKTAEALVGVAKRYAIRGPLVPDLSGGYDSRLVTAALARAGATFTVTVNGHDKHPDVVIAQRVARAAGWPLRHYGAKFSGQMTEEIRREVAYMSRGELDALFLYLHLQTRPVLARDHVAHIQGGGGELLRNFPWGQEFAGIGRRRRASVDRVLRYRLLNSRVLSDALFVKPYRSLVYEDLRARMSAVIDEGVGTLTTQQLDAVYLVRLTGHLGGYTSSLFDLLPSGVPLMQRTMVEHAVSLPWTMRLSAGLLRQTIALLHPQAAAVETTYGSTAGPVSLSKLPMETRQAFGRLRHLADKVDGVVFGGKFGRVVRVQRTEPKAPDPPFRTDEFREFLTPARMYSAGLYIPREIATLVSDPETPMAALSRIATLEHVCREIGAQPGFDVLTAV